MWNGFGTNLLISRSGGKLDTMLGSRGRERFEPGSADGGTG